MNRDHLNRPSMSSTVFAAHCASARQKRQATEEEQPTDPRLKGEPHAVEIIPSLRGSVLMIGFDRAGEVMVELRVPCRQYHPRMAEKLRRWMREHDDTPHPFNIL